MAIYAVYYHYFLGHSICVATRGFLLLATQGIAFRNTASGGALLSFLNEYLAMAFTDTAAGVLPLLFLVPYILEVLQAVIKWCTWYVRMVRSQLFLFPKFGQRCISWWEWTRTSKQTIKPFSTAALHSKLVGITLVSLFAVVSNRDRIRYNTCTVLSIYILCMHIQYMLRNTCCFFVLWQFPTAICCSSAAGNPAAL